MTNIIRKVYQRAFHPTDNPLLVQGARKGEELVTPMLITFVSLVLLHYNIFNPHLPERHFINIVTLALFLFTMFFQTVIVPSKVFSSFWSNVEVTVFIIINLIVVYYTGGLNSIWIFVIYLNNISMIPSLATGFFLPLGVISSLGLFIISLLSPETPNVLGNDLLSRLAIVVSPLFFSLLGRTLTSHLHKEHQQIDNLSKLADRLQREKSKISSVLHNLAEGIIMLNPEGIVTFATPKAATILEKKPAQLLKKSFHQEISLMNENNQPITLKIINPSETISLKNVYQAGKRKVRFNITASPLVEKARSTPEEPEGTIIVLNETTAEYNLERMKLKFVAEGMQKLKKPLTKLKENITALQGKTDSLSKEGVEFARRLSAAADKLDELRTDLRVIAAVESHRVKPAFQHVNLNKLVRELGLSFARTAEEKGLDFIIQVPQVQLHTQVDRQQVQEAISNLVRNAIKFTPEGKVALSLQKSSGENTAVISVSDTGPGIPAKSLPHLFTKFYRITSPLGAGNKGLGMGLYISKKFIELNEGDISVQSRLDKGTTFKVELPLDD